MAQRILILLRHFTQICAYGAGRGSFLGPVFTKEFLSDSFITFQLVRD